MSKEQIKQTVSEYMTFLREEAKKQGISAEKIGAIIGKSGNSVRRSLTGKHCPQLDTLLSISNVLGVEFIPKLITSDEPEEPEEELEPVVYTAPFLLCVNPVKQEFYILHRGTPACLLWVRQSEPLRFIVEEVYDEVNDPDSVLSMPFIKEAQQFFKKWYEKYKGTLLF